MKKSFILKFVACSAFVSVGVASGVAEYVAEADKGIVSEIASLIEPKEVMAAEVEYAVNGGTLKFDTSTGTITIYTGDPTDVVIPSSINGVKVTSIGDKAFNRCYSLTSITIPDSVTSIGEGAFYKCESLTSITIPDSVTSIGDEAFGYCESLTSITIPDSVTSIGYRAFFECDSLTSINIPDGVTSIGDEAFLWCESLTSITIPDSVTSIVYGAFGYCESLTSITIPDSVTSIGDYVFANCHGLTSITIPDSVTSIGDWAFLKCINLTSITIPDSVTSIGTGAFFSCDKLKDVYYGGSKEQWGKINIYKTNNNNNNDNDNLLNANIHYNSSMPTTTTTTTTPTPAPTLSENYITVTGIEGGKIEFNKSTGIITGAESTITTLTIPSTINGVAVQGIGEGAFKDCTKLTTVTIPYGIATIPDSAFYNCTSLRTINLENTIRVIGSNAFYNCNALSTINFSGALDQWNTYISINSTGNSALSSATKNCTITPSSTDSLQSVNSSTLCNQKLTGISSGSVTLVSGSLPTGLGLRSDGTLYGVPTTSGNYSFIILNNGVYKKYTISITVPTATNVLSNNMYNVITQLPTISSNTQNYSITIDRANSYFDSLYINGIKLTKGIDFEISGTTNTKITIYATFLSRLASGNNTLTSIFNTGTSTNTGASSQVFNKTSSQVTTSSMPFADVAIDDWYYASLEYTYKNNIFKGTSDTTFSSNDYMTRAMLVSTLYRIEGEPNATENPFTDVKLSDWYGNAVAWASENGIVNGTSETTFAPNDFLTREQMATILDRYCTYKGIALPVNTSATVADINTVFDYAKDSVETMYRAGVLNSDSANYFHPKNHTTRADAAYILAQFLLTY